MTPLERYAALDDRHFDVADVVRELEAEWGAGAPLEKVALRVGLSEGVAAQLLAELDSVGLLAWFPDDGVAFDEAGPVVLGEIG